MYCSHCGVPLSGSAAFCSRCGESSTPPSNAYTEPPVYETCQVTVVKVLGLYNFVAQAVHPSRGVQKAGSSPTFNIDPNTTTLGLKHAHAQRCLNSLVRRLVKEGWEPTPTSTDQFWYNLRFRRSVRA